MSDGGKARVNAWKTLLGTGALWLGCLVAFPAIPARGFCFANLPLIAGLGLVCVVVEQCVVSLVAGLLGDLPLLVCIGSGPKLLQIRLRRRTSLSLHVLPVLGLTVIVTDREAGQRRRTALAMFAGVAVLVVAVIAVVALEHLDLHEFGRKFRGEPSIDVAFVLAALFIIYVDTLGAIGILTNSPGLSKIDDSVLKVRRRLGAAITAADLLDKHAYDQARSVLNDALADAPDDVTLQTVLAMTMSATGDPEAFALVERLVKTDAPPQFKAVLLNAWAWECYLRGDATLCAEADRASRAAVESNPKDPSMLDTRGHVLLWLGRHAEAEQQLLRAHALALNARTRVSAAAALAMVFAATDRPTEAAEWLARARGEDLHLPVVARAIAAVEPLRR